MPLSRGYKADRIFHKTRIGGKWLTDTMDGRVKQLDGNLYSQVFANKTMFSPVCIMDRNSKAGESLRTFVNEHGVHADLTSDSSKEQTNKRNKFIKQVQKNDINHHVIEPDRHNQNPVEGVIRELRQKWFRVMVRKQVPRRLLDYGVRWVYEVM